MHHKNMARALGWASFAIGLTEIFAPRRLEEAMGISNGENSGILRVLGVREVMSGVEILAHRDPTPGVWARVAGDVLDTALLGKAALKTRRPGGMAAISALVLGIGIADALCAVGLTRHKHRMA